MKRRKIKNCVLRKNVYYIFIQINNVLELLFFFNFLNVFLISFANTSIYLWLT